MKFTIITPSYNSESQIKQCIGSVKKQALNNLHLNIEIEHIIQDGLSNDGTVEILANYDSGLTSQKKYKFSWESEQDKGMYDAINKGWSKSNGDILSWLNHDEQYLPGTLQKVKKVFDQNPDIDVVWGNMIIVDHLGNPISSRREIPLREFYIKNDFLYAISCTMFFRRRLFDINLLVFNPEFRSAGDLELILKLLNNGIKFYHINEYLSLFGVDGNNLTVSLGDNMAKEVARIQKEYGALPIKILRQGVKGLRFLERFVKGCYKKDNLQYTFVIDENGNSKEIKKDNVSFRFTYEYTERILSANDSK